MDCEPASTRWAPHGPKGWERSGRSIYALCKRLLDAGYPPTLFLTPGSAEMHAPLVEDLRTGGAELGLLLQPHTLEGAPKRYLGQLGREQQRDVIARSARAWDRAVATRPASARSCLFSASDDTFPLLREHGIVQSSLSSPGRRVRKHAAVWTGAPPDPHYVDPTSRLASGSLGLLEVPVTADASRIIGGLSCDLNIDHGAFEAWHRPLLEGHLARMEERRAPFKMICAYASSARPYDLDEHAPTSTLRAILDYLDHLGDRFDVRPVTLAATHAAFGREAALIAKGDP